MRDNCNGRKLSETRATRILRRSLSAVIISAIACLSLSAALAAGEEVIYDRDYNLRYRIDENGRIYDRNEKLKGRIDDGRIYDRDYNLRYRVEGGRVYDKDWDLKYRREGDRIYDRNYKLKGRIKGR